MVMSGMNWKHPPLILTWVSTAHFNFLFLEKLYSCSIYVFLANFEYAGRILKFDPNPTLPLWSIRLSSDTYSWMPFFKYFCVCSWNLKKILNIQCVTHYIHWYGIDMLHLCILMLIFPISTLANKTL